MLSMGSKCIADLSWPFTFAVRGTGDGAKLANCGSGENEPVPLVLGGFNEPLIGDGVQVGIE
jgi:hypothetical protein